MNDDTPARAHGRKEQARAWEPTGESCGRCGVRADVDCPHRPGAGRAPPAIENPNVKGRDGRTPKPISGGGRYRQFPGLQGLNFRGKDRK